MAKSSITPGQERQLGGLVAERLKRLVAEEKMGRKELQRVFAHGGDFQDRIEPILIDLGRGKYWQEEVSSTCTYPADYQPRSIQEQVEILLGHFSGLDASAILKFRPPRRLAQGVKAWFVFIKPMALAKIWQEALDLVLERLNQQRRGCFKNWLEGGTNIDHLVLTEKAERMTAKVIKQWPKGDFFIMPCQFGLLHRGRSMRWAEEVFTNIEFGLGPYEIGTMLLTHPERLQGYENLWVDCAGARWRKEVKGAFENGPCFFWGESDLCFNARWVDYAYAGFGSASGFLPQ